MTATAFVRRAAVLVVALASVLAIASACGVGDLSLVGKNCPCATDQGFVCDTSTNKCVQSGVTFDAGPVTCDDAGCACSVDANCGDPGAPKCVNGQCVACATNPDSCPIGTYCLNGQTCSPGCKSDADCAANTTDIFCDTARHQCHSCRPDHGNADCKNGQVCSSSGTCAIACNGDASGCPSGGTCCFGLCVDTTSDIDNCNTCGTRCLGADTLCCSGSCTDPLGDVNHCGTCAACSTLHGTPSCGGGNCSYVCNAGYGHCAGDTGCATANLNSLHQCGSACVDCTTAIQHASGAACSGNGGTSCDYSTCSSSYLDLDGNRANGCETHCGGANEICCPGGFCSFGTCQGNNRCPDN